MKKVLFCLIMMNAFILSAGPMSRIEHGVIIGKSESQQSDGWRFELGPDVRKVTQVIRGSLVFKPAFEKPPTLIIFPYDRENEVTVDDINNKNAKLHLSVTNNPFKKYRNEGIETARYFGFLAIGR